ncbi:MAG TPA: hypothetical protein DEG47_01055 [Cyanobacteria bacterium UBA11148]|nr:hypothetical protein [Cyanobacteria bacterium UBA11148]
MTYKKQLFPWCIIRHLPKMQRIVVCRYRRRSDAESHLQILRQLMPTLSLTIIFDITSQDENPPRNQ